MREAVEGHLALSLHVVPLSYCVDTHTLTLTLTHSHTLIERERERAESNKALSLHVVAKPHHFEFEVLHQPDVPRSRIRIEELEVLRGSLDQVYDLACNSLVCGAGF